PSSAAGSLDWGGSLQVSIAAQGGEGYGYSVPLKHPSGPSIIDATRDLVGTAIITVSRRSNVGLQLVAGYTFTGPEGRAVPIPAMMTRNLPLPTILGQR